MKQSEALLYARTLRTLRPAQLLGRARRALPSAAPKVRPAPPVREAAPLPPPAARNASLVGPTTIEHLGERGDVASPGDWTNEAQPLLWLYHLHYFDDLRASGSEQRSAWNDALLDRWIAEHPPGAAPGWDPYPTSIRIVNWVRWARAHGLPAGALASLATQARHLRKNLEFHLLGNHLLANAKALVFAGACFTGREAAEWTSKGLALLKRELAEQVLADGGHFERSPMYHSTILEDLLDLLALVRWTPDAFDDPEGLGERLGRVAGGMLDWLVRMSHPDGGIALFNDAALGHAPSPSALVEYAVRVGVRPPSPVQPGVTHLDASGYVRVERGRCVAFLDVGEIGPSYLAGHAHADTLSFECSVDGNRLAVNGGTSLYAPGPERQRQRGTAAHSTVEVDGADSSEVWASFRVARRARPIDLRIDDGLARIEVRCAHDGYRRLPGDVVHTRTWRLDERTLGVLDVVDGAFTSAVGRIHLHPHMRAEADGQAVVLHRTGAPATRIDAVKGSLELGDGVWAPRFGATLPNQHVRCVPDEGGRSRVQIAW
ncbi:MAG: alginate lyase family protein [Planctomycetota bacterium]